MYYKLLFPAQHSTAAREVQRGPDRVTGLRRPFPSHKKRNIQLWIIRSNGTNRKKKLLGIWLSHKILIELKAFTILQCMPNKYLWASLYSWTLCLYKVNTAYCDLCVVCMVITATQRLEMSLNGKCFTDHLFKQREKDQSKEHWYSGWIRPPGSLRINTINSLSLQNLLWSRVLIFMLLFWESEGHTHWETTLVTHNVSSWIGSIPSQDNFWNTSILQFSTSQRSLCDWAIT